MHTDMEHEVKLLLREAYARRRWIVAGFVLVTLAALAAGLSWPKSYQTSTSIYVDNQNIIGQLMEGAAVRTTVADSAENARSIILGHQNLMWVLEQGGWLEQKPSPAQQEALIDSIRQRTQVSNEGDQIIRIAYRDSDPQRALEVTKLLANVLIREMREAKEEESNAAYTFINRQVRQYEQELARTEARLQELGVDPELVSAGDFSQRIAQLRDQVSTLQQELREANITQTTVQRQLAEYPERATVDPQLRDLQSQLAELRTRYKESYPDIVAIKAQIAELKGNGGGGGSTDPVYQSLQSRLFEANTRINTLESRLAGARQKLASVQKAAAGAGQGGEFEQLVRDYRVSQDIYADLLKRRESARVSMNLDAEQQGLTLRINQPAYLPHQASGPRLLHFAVGGLLLGFAVPLGSVFAFTKVDPRLRKANALSEDMGLPVLAVVPHMETPREARAEARGIFYAGVIVVLTIAAVVGVLLLRLQGGI